MENKASANTMGDALKQAMASLGGIQRKEAIGSWIEHHYPGEWKPNTLTGHLSGCSVNNPNGIKHHRSFPRFLYHRGQGEYELYDAERHGVFDEDGFPEGQQRVETATTGEIVARVVAEIEDARQTEFAYEAHLRDYLARNLSLLEKGMTLWTGDKATSVEYNVEGRRVDILARDAEGTPVVIELKLSRGHERTIGQALYYRGKLKQLLSKPKIRIVMVAAEITDELQIAASEVSDVEVFVYALTMQLKKITDLEQGAN